MTNTDVGLIMGSQSDWPTMIETANILTDLKISFETKIVSDIGLQTDFLAIVLLLLIAV